MEIVSPIPSTVSANIQDNSFIAGKARLVMMTESVPS